MAECERHRPRIAGDDAPLRVTVSEARDMMTAASTGPSPDSIDSANADMTALATMLAGGSRDAARRALYAAVLSRPVVDFAVMSPVVTGDASSFDPFVTTCADRKNGKAPRGGSYARGSLLCRRSPNLRTSQRFGDRPESVNTPLEKTDYARDASDYLRRRMRRIRLTRATTSLGSWPLPNIVCRAGPTIRASSRVSRSSTSSGAIAIARTRARPNSSTVGRFSDLIRSRYTAVRRAVCARTTSGC